jgi:branched-chain amino acid transport system substrate-binding protein
MCIRMLSAVALFALAFAAERAVAQKKYDPGATDSEIKIGNIMPYSGAFSEYGAIGRAEAAYFHRLF